MITKSGSKWNIIVNIQDKCKSKLIINSDLTLSPASTYLLSPGSIYIVAYLASLFESIMGLSNLPRSKQDPRFPTPNSQACPAAYLPTHHSRFSHQKLWGPALDTLSFNIPSIHQAGWLDYKPNSENGFSTSSPLLYHDQSHHTIVSHVASVSLLFLHSTSLLESILLMLPELLLEKIRTSHMVTQY